MSSSSGPRFKRNNISLQLFQVEPQKLVCEENTLYNRGFGFNFHVKKNKSDGLLSFLP